MAALAAALIEDRIHAFQVKQFWRDRIDSQLWVRGNLKLTDYMMLELNPQQVAYLVGSWNVSLDQFLENRLKYLEFVKREGHLGSYEFYYNAFRFQTLERDLPVLPSQPDKLEILLNLSIIYGNAEIFHKVAQKIPPRQPQLTRAFENRQFHMVDILTSPPYNLRVFLRDVVAGGRVEDLDRFQLRNDLLGNLGFGNSDLIGQTNPEMFQLWHQSLDQNVDSEEYQAVTEHVVIQALEINNAPLLENLVEREPDWGSEIIAYCLNSENLENRLPDIIELGDERMIRVVFHCLNKRQNLSYKV